MVAKINTTRMMESSTRNLGKMFKSTGGTTSETKIDLESIFEEIGNYDVLVGIPEAKAQRKEDGDGVNNAELAFMHTHGVRSSKMVKEMDKNIKKGINYSKAYKMYLLAHGSPAYRVPPRPIIEPAIEANKEALAEGLKKASLFFMDGEKENAVAELNRTGLRAQNYVRKWFTDPRNNWPPNAPSTIERKGSDKPLIDTGELRKSISYVVKTKEGVQLGKTKVNTDDDIKKEE